MARKGVVLRFVFFLSPRWEGGSWDLKASWRLKGVDRAKCP